MNRADLMDELALTALGQYFMDSFYRRASIYKVKSLPRKSCTHLCPFSLLISMPGMRWNFNGAFIGVLETALPAAPAAEDNDNRSLVFSTFLATPLLPSGPSYTEEKFSGNTEVGNNSGSIGQAIDAYAHHVVVDSLGSILFADLQGMHVRTAITVVMDIKMVLAGIIGPGNTVVLFDPQAHT